MHWLFWGEVFGDPSKTGSLLSFMMKCISVNKSACVGTNPNRVRASSTIQNRELFYS